MTDTDDGDGSLVALVGATGGAGTTRTSVELATTLARGGRSAVVVDAAFATQGLSEYVAGRIAPDVTALVTDETNVPVRSATVELADAPLDDEAQHSFGSVELLPAYAPFERLARAKTPAAAERFEELLAGAADAFDHAIVDVPPVASNQAIAAVSAADTVVAVTPADDHGTDSLVRLRDRLADLDVPVDAAVGVGGELPVAGSSTESSSTESSSTESSSTESSSTESSSFVNSSTMNLSLPGTDPSPHDAPSCLEDDRYGEALVELAESTIGVTLSIAFEPESVRDRVAAAVTDRVGPNATDGS
ncbi:Chromosome partitioning ATPase, ParA family [Halalkaliarchaeum sp. AArc-CO]|uniref:ParA family protein n=1 Tax=Halalkaliarchaeum sp. AArc-CO TaxID=2866381 RepID=UPI00217EC763|nr:ParA family protein [Halalkaliarchaeum sp. AArc-CO]UWG49352.1 Chromosome partitioning ATPase, ParA family [Halalkaliarchaeum sp. AArc-CO]